MTTFGEWFGSLLIAGIAGGLAALAVGTLIGTIVFFVAFLCMAGYAVTHP